jgi:Radical SAM superfamily/Domain of unknown function (DUF4070)
MRPLAITFVHAPLLQQDQSDGALFGPLWAYTLSAHVPASWKASIVDCLRQDSSTIGPAQVFAFSGTNQDIDSIRTVHAELKAKYPAATFILGGPITWSLQNEGKLELVDFFDRIFVLDGEETLPAFLHHFEAGTLAALPKVVRGDRFPLARAEPIRFDLYRAASASYYGATIEVSRGCPFLCEFCDVRVLPGNNESNNAEPALVVHELENYFAAGVTQFVFVCDNFIGDISWARQCVDAILAWQEKSHAKISIFTWVTINIAKLPDLMAKMRRAGFCVLHIGIESVNQNALLETAKIQNRISLKPAVLTIQSFGFVVTPGFIFGFDSDGPDLFAKTLDFVVETGLVGGDPSFLMAMPGTPLWDRMRRTRRLIEPTSAATARRKIATNIRYLLDEKFLARGFVRFIEDLTSTRTQWKRFRNHVASLVESDNFVAPGGHAGRPTRSLARVLRLQLSHRSTRITLLRRGAYLLRSPTRILAIVAGWLLTKKVSRQGRDLSLHLQLWIYFWTSMGLRYRGLKEDDLALHSVGTGFDVSTLVEPAAPQVDVPAGRLLGQRKVWLQARHTNEGLRRLVAATVDGARGSSGK